MARLSPGGLISTAPFRALALSWLVWRRLLNGEEGTVLEDPRAVAGVSDEDDARLECLANRVKQIGERSIEGGFGGVCAEGARRAHGRYVLLGNG